MKYACVNCEKLTTRVTASGLCAACQRNLRQQVLEFISTGVIRYSVYPEQRDRIAKLCLESGQVPSAYLKEAAEIWLVEKRGCQHG